jgi:DMSO/TMAO reductase YedYZ heme-binding membrane subunit
VMSLLAIFLPILAFIVFVILLVVVIRSWRTVRRRFGALRH